MACACQKNRKQYEVVSEAGKVVYSGTSEPTARAVAKRYPGSKVREKPKTAAQASR